MHVQFTCLTCGAPLVKDTRQRVNCTKQCPPTLETRFWCRVDKDGPIPSHVPNLGKCWVWVGLCDPDGYGRIHVIGRFGLRKRDYRAHKIAYMLEHGGPPPASTPFITHLCDNGKIGCVRPSHLMADTHEGNMRGLVERGRSNKGERHWHAKVTESDVRRIRALYASGSMRYIDIAQMYGVSKGTVLSIVRRINWGHVA